MQRPAPDDLQPGDFITLLPRALPALSGELGLDRGAGLQNHQLFKHEPLDTKHGLPFLIEHVQLPLIVGGLLQNNGTIVGPAVFDVRTISYMRLQPEYVHAYLKYSPEALPRLQSTLKTRGLPPLLTPEKARSAFYNRKIEEFMTAIFKPNPKDPPDDDTPSVVPAPVPPQS